MDTVRPAVHTGRWVTAEGRGEPPDSRPPSSTSLASMQGGCQDSDPEQWDSDPEEDAVLEKIQQAISQAESASDDQSSQHSLVLSDASSGEDTQKTSQHYTNIPYGIQPAASYQQARKSTDIMGVTYNGRMRQFVILDSKGIITWKRDAVGKRVTRCLSYPRYEYRLLTYLVYARKYNCYFALAKDFSLKVLNRDFHETFSVGASLRSVIFLLFNPIRDELITGGVDGTKVYLFHQAANAHITEVKPLANFKLTLKRDLPHVGGSWVKKVELDYHLEHLYCCSDTDLYLYNLEGRQLFHFHRAHSMSITGCRYSLTSKLLVTSSLDTEVKVWSMTGGLVHTFRGHSRAVTTLLLHPHNSNIVITAALDGTLRMWSLDTMDALYCLLVSSHGVLYLGLTDDQLLYLGTARSLTLWRLNSVLNFWSLARSTLRSLQLEGCPGKTRRVMALGRDSSVRLFARAQQKTLCTVLPPPSISPLQEVLGVCYSRQFNVLFMLLHPTLLWVYTTRTDPACRIAVWDVLQLQTMNRRHEPSQDRMLLQTEKALPSRRATENGSGSELPCPCLCVAILKSSAMVWTDEGCCCPIRHCYLLLGLEDGRILFMDPVVKGRKFMEFKVSKDPVVAMRHDEADGCLCTMVRGKQRTTVHFWSLPDLEMLHQVHCSSDITAFTRIGSVCMTGHQSGRVVFHSMDLAQDPGLYKTHTVEEEEVEEGGEQRPQHPAPVITVDACVPLRIFCSCSGDGSIKVWEEDGALLTEVMLDDSLSAACFLNHSADLLVAVHHHIFIISHTKLCPHLKPEAPEDLSSDRESYIYEDPAVVYEGFVADPDPIDLENYLVPYEIEFSKDFLEGKVTLEPAEPELEESDEEGGLSLAPTEVYLSPPSTPGSLSRVDLTLAPEPSTYDLLDQMQRTLQALQDKQLVRHRKRGVVIMTAPDSTLLADACQEAGPAREGAGPTQEEEPTQGEVPTQKEGLEERGAGRRVEMPKFGVSPGPSPTITPSSTPEILSDQESTEEETSDTEDRVKALLPPKKIPDLQLVAAQPSGAKPKPPDSAHKPPEIPAPKRTRRAIADVEIDAASLMRGRRAAPSAGKKEADHSHLLLQADSQRAEKAGRSAVKKKTVTQRRPVRTGPPPPQDQAHSASGESSQPLQQSGEGEALRADSTERQAEPGAGLGSGSISVEVRLGSAGSGTQRAGSGGSSGRRSPTRETVEVARKMLPPPLPEVIPPDSPANQGSRSVWAATARHRQPLSFPSPGPSPTPAHNRPVTPGSESHAALQAAGAASSQTQREGEWGEGARLTTGVSCASSGEGDSLLLAAQLGSGAQPTSSLSEIAAVQSSASSVHRLSHTTIPTPNTPYTPSTPPLQRTLPPDTQPRRFNFDLQPSHSHSLQADHFHLDPGHSPTSEDDHFDTDSKHSHTLVDTSVTSHVEMSPYRPKIVAVTSMESTMDFSGRESAMSISVEGRPPSEADSVFQSEAGAAAVSGGDALASVSMSEFDAEDEDEHRAWSRVGLPDPALLDQPPSPSLHHRQLDDLLKRQPFAGGFSNFQAEELRAVYEAAYNRYQRVHGGVCQDFQKLHSNKGVTFEDNWQERVLERHMLLRMQRALRAQSARQKRHLLHQQQQQQFLQQQQKEGFLQRVKSAPAPKQLTAGVSTHSQPARPNTVGPALLHAPGPAPTPTPSTSRPATPTRPSITPAPHPHPQHHGMLPHRALKDREKQRLGCPFRLRLREAGHYTPAPPTSALALEPWMLDPRHPAAIRPRSRKSIPSKCSRYVLLSRPRTSQETPLPTPLEEELLAARFPDQSVRLLQSAGAALRPTPPQTHYGIPYSPFAMYG